MNEAHIFTVTELTAIIKELFDSSFSKVTLEGEVSNCRPSGAGHLYFSLKDNNSMISAVIFKGQLNQLNIDIKDGQKVTVVGRVSVYEKRGSYQVICESVTISGTGDILALLEERKRQLASEGLFDQQKKRALPLLPGRVAVVTSPTGAAIRDILQVINRRNAGIGVTILPCLVQGEGAGEQIAAQIRRANEYKLGDVIIVARGGGSIEDLLPFSDELVVRTAAASELPLVSGVGHETDTTLIDYAADVRAPTPSVAAEMVTTHREELETRLNRAKEALKMVVAHKIDSAKAVVEREGPEKLHQSFLIKLEPYLMRLDDCKEDILDGIKERVRDTNYRIHTSLQELNAWSPLNIVERGYAIVANSRGEQVKRASELSAKELFSVRLQDGVVKGTVEEIDNEKI